MKFRTPHTHAEAKASADPEIQDLVRTKRRPKALPTNWWDLQRSKGRKPRYKDHRK
jgi:hypothetical protein